MAELSRNAMVLRFLLQAAAGIGRIKLAKYAYLADLEAIRYLGKPISQFRYIRDNFGPFDASGFFDALEELKTWGAATECAVHYPNGYRGYSYDPTREPVEYDFSVAEAEILEFVTETYMGMSGKGLCEDVVYQTEPMQDAEFGKDLPMDRVAPSERDPLGFSLERMLAGEASASTGRHRPLAEAFRELSARYQPGS